MIMCLAVAMIPSFVQGRPTGKETGKYLALDLGGTNLRVCEVNLLGDSKVTIHQQKFVVSDELKTGEMRHLCDYIADCVDSFLTENGSDKLDNDLQLGFTFSFPVNQTAINRGTLMQWTKGFACHGAVGKDVVIMLQDSFRRKNLNVNIAAVSFEFAHGRAPCFWQKPLSLISNIPLYAFFFFIALHYRSSMIRSAP